MIVENTRYQVRSDQADGLIEAYRQEGRPLLDSPHCQGYDVAGCVDEATSRSRTVRGCG